MFERTQEVTRKDKYGFVEEGNQRRAVIMGTPSHSTLSKRELALLATVEPIQAGDIRFTDSTAPFTQENPLLIITVTAEILGGTRNLVFDGEELYVAHGEQRYSLHDEYMLRRRADQLGIKCKDLEHVIGVVEATIKQKISLLARERATTNFPSSLSSLG